MADKGDLAALVRKECAHAMMERSATAVLQNIRVGLLTPVRTCPLRLLPPRARPVQGPAVPQERWIEARLLSLRSQRCGLPAL